MACLRAALLAVIVAAAPASAEPLTSATLEPVVDGLVTAQPAMCRPAGLAVVVVQNGAVVLAKGYGYADISAHQPVDPERTLFRVASVTKNVTATAVMQLVERRALDLDANVNTYLTRFQLADTYAVPITARHLLTHTAGLDNTWIGCAARRESDVDIGGHLAAHVPVRIAPPGEIASYNNHHYVLLGHLVEAISRQRFDDYVRDHIFQPLGMAHSTFTTPADGLARPYTIGDAGLEPAWDIPPTNDVPASSLVATASDMARYMLAHLGHGARLLDPATEHAMQASQFALDPQLPGIGFGFFEDFHHGWRTVGHDGDIPGYAAAMTLVPELDLGVFVVTNVTAGECMAGFGVTNAILDRFYPRSVPPPVASHAEHAAQVAGSYRSLRRTRRSFLDVTVLAGGDDLAVEATTDGLRIGRGTYVETAPLLFERSDGARRVAFRTADGATWMSFGVLSYERIAWYDALTLHRIVLVACLVVFLLVAIGGPVAVGVRRLRRRPVSRTRFERAARWIAWSVAIAPVGFVLGVALGTLRAGVLWFAYGVPTWFAVLLVLPILGAACALALVPLVAIAWRRRLAGRIQLTVIAAAGLAFTWWLHYWNLLGWRY